MIDELKRGMLFARLTDAQLQRVAQRALRVQLAEGESLFEQDDPADRFYFLLSGQIKLYRLAASGNEKVIEIVRPGETFAEALMFLDQPVYPVGAQALQRALVISLDSRDFVDMLAGSVTTCLQLLGDMSRRLRGLIGEIDELTLHSATCRVGAYLLAQMSGADEFDLEVPKQVLASRLSVKPETFSRIIKQLNTQGILEVHGCRVTIRDRQALQQLADGCSLSVPEARPAITTPCRQ